MIAPVRLRLYRYKGFNLQALSQATNGLPAINVARPSKWGNPWTIGTIACGCRSAGECDHNSFRCESAEDAVAQYRWWSDNWSNTKNLLGALGELRGKNLACWCAPGAPCHADLLLERANRAGGAGALDR